MALHMMQSYIDIDNASEPVVPGQPYYVNAIKQFGRIRYGRMWSRRMPDFAIAPGRKLVYRIKVTFK